MDPVFGGGDTRYGYPNDPINSTDISGESWWRNAWVKGKKWWRKGQGVAQGIVHGRWARSGAKRAWSYVRKKNPYLRIYDGRVSWGAVRKHWVKYPKGYKKTFTAFHGHHGRSGGQKGNRYYGVDFHGKKRSFGMGFGYNRNIKKWSKRWRGSFGFYS